MLIHRLTGAALLLFSLGACQPAASEPETKTTPEIAAASEAATTPVAIVTSPDPSHCFIEVDGKVWLDAPCPVDTTDPDSTSINTGVEGAAVFAYVNTFEGEAQAYWNGGEGANHAHEDLGSVTANGACWSNARARLCKPATPATR